jgi:hypothetical protein
MNMVLRWQKRLADMIKDLEMEKLFWTRRMNTTQSNDALQVKKLSNCGQRDMPLWIWRRL